jgi:hypothetical protein
MRSLTRCNPLFSDLREWFSATIPSKNFLTLSLFQNPLVKRFTCRTRRESSFRLMPGDKPLHGSKLVLNITCDIVVVSLDVVNPVTVANKVTLRESRTDYRDCRHKTLRGKLVLPPVTLSSGDSIRGRHLSFPWEDSRYLDKQPLRFHRVCTYVGRRHGWWLGVSRRSACRLKEIQEVLQHEPVVYSSARHTILPFSDVREPALSGVDELEMRLRTKIPWKHGESALSYEVAPTSSKIHLYPPVPSFYSRRGLLQPASTRRRLFGFDTLAAPKPLTKDNSVVYIREYARHLAIAGYGYSLDGQYLVVWW